MVLGTLASRVNVQSELDGVNWASETRGVGFMSELDIPVNPVGRPEEDQLYARQNVGIQRMLPRHYRIVELALDGMGVKEIAGVMGMTPVGVGLILKSEIVQGEMARRRVGLERKQDDVRVCHVDMARSTLERSSLRAAEKLDEQVDHVDPRVAQGACDKILSMVMGKRDEAGQRGITVINAEQLNVLMCALGESRSGVGQQVVSTAQVCEVQSGQLHT